MDSYAPQHHVEAAPHRFLILVGCIPTKVGAETIETKYQYAAKAACSLLSTFGDLALAQGIYRTFINIGNPTNETVKFAVKPNVSGSLGAPSGGIGGVVAKKGELARMPRYRLIAERSPASSARPRMAFVSISPLSKAS